MTAETPGDVQAQINAVPWTNGRMLVTGATVAGIFTAVVGLFALYGSLSGANTWTGANSFTGPVSISASSLPNVQRGDAIPATGQPYINSSGFVVFAQ